jgi:hypothetical protein
MKSVREIMELEFEDESMKKNKNENVWDVFDELNK